MMKAHIALLLALLVGVFMAPVALARPSSHGRKALQRGGGGDQSHDHFHMEHDFTTGTTTTDLITANDPSTMPQGPGGFDKHGGFGGHGGHDGPMGGRMGDLAAMLNGTFNGSFDGPHGFGGRMGGHHHGGPGMTGGSPDGSPGPMVTFCYAKNVTWSIDTCATQCAARGACTSGLWLNSTDCFTSTMPNISATAIATPSNASYPMWCWAGDEAAPADGCCCTGCTNAGYFGGTLPSFFDGPDPMVPMPGAFPEGPTVSFVDDGITDDDNVEDSSTVVVPSTTVVI